MRNIKKTALYCTAVAAAVILLVGTALTVGRARSEKLRYIKAETEMARRDLCAAADEMLRALRDGDAVGLNRAAGKAEAYLSRAGLGDCGEIYGEIKRICSGECSEEDCVRFAEAVKKAADGGEFFREASDGEAASTEAETTEDALASRMLKRLGKSRDDVARRRAEAFACPNAEFDERKCGIPQSFAYSGENIFLLVSGETPRVVMYCFDRDADDRYSVTEEEAEQTAELIIKKEKLRLGEKRTIKETDGVYRILCYGKDDLSDIPLATFEIYSDTGRLRLYDAVNYYNNPR